MRLIPILLLTTVTLSSIASPTADPQNSLEGKQGYERRTLIGEMADTIWKNERFSINRGIELLQGMSGSDRYYATRTLLGENRQQRNLLPNRMTPAEMQQLLEGTLQQRGEIIQLLSDQGIPAAYLSPQEIRSLLQPLPPIQYDRALRALLGSNRMDRNYSLPHFKPDEVATLLLPSDDRAGMIRYLSNRALLTVQLSVEEADPILQQQSSMDRHDSIKALLGSNRLKQNYLKLPLGFSEASQLLDGAALKSELLRYLADQGAYIDHLTAEQAYQLLQGIQQTDRLNSLKALLGENNLQQRYLQSPLSSEDAVMLMEGVAYRDEMVGFLADQQLLPEVISPQEALKLLETLKRADRHDALRALLGGNEAHHTYLNLPLSIADTQSLIEKSAYRDELIQWVTDQGQLQSGIGGSEALQLLNGLVGDARFQALATLLGENLQQRRYLSNTIGASDWIRLLQRSANRLQLIELIQQQQRIEIESGEALHQLLETLYGAEREQAARILTQR